MKLFHILLLSALVGLCSARGMHPVALRHGSNSDSGEIAYQSLTSLRQPPMAIEQPCRLCGGKVAFEIGEVESSLSSLELSHKHLSAVHSERKFKPKLSRTVEI
eukprot:3409807-Rhodomonas_salina.2